MDLKEALQPYAARSIAHRRYLHTIPELSFEEYKTAAYIREQLADMDVEMEDKYSGNSVVGYVVGTRPVPPTQAGEPGPNNKTVAFRADIDALPVQEAVDLPYKSTVDGLMHACGHDAHAGTMLEMVRFLSEHRDLFSGRMKFMFQQGEEKLPGGGRILCEEGVMDGVDEVYTYHCSSRYKIGEVAMTRGASKSSIGMYHVTITGHGGHGGYPHLSINPVVCAATAVAAINQLVTTSVDALRSGVITTGYIQAGVARVTNVIPGTCSFGGNIRSLDNETIDLLFDKVEAILRGTCEAYGCTFTYEKEKGYPATIGTDAQFDIINAVREDMGLINATDKPQMAADDFAYYALERPSAYAMIGMNDESMGPVPIPHHNARFTIDDERGMPIALEFMVRTFLKAVGCDPI
ncbi:MAG: amidohydrolase [Mogibacterium sp.]|nr:amidohydrolase [Mogibacterium sp.]